MIKQKKGKSDLCFGNHLIHISLELIDSKRLGKEAELLLADRVIDIENNAAAESRDIELVNLLLTEIRLGGLEEVGGNLMTNQESNLLVENIQSEDTAELRIFMAEHHNGTFYEFNKSSNKRPRGDHWRETLCRSRHYKCRDELSHQEGGRYQQPHIR